MTEFHGVIFFGQVGLGDFFFVRPTGFNFDGNARGNILYFFG